MLANNQNVFIVISKTYKSRVINKETDMAKTETKDNSLQIKRLAQDSNYYNNVFKKTEKVVSVIFYILAQITDTEHVKDELQRIKDKSLRTHEQALRSLQLPSYAARAGVEQLQFELLGLESELRIIEAARILPADITLLILEQIDAVQRQLQNHYKEQSFHELTDSTAETLGVDLPKSKPTISTNTSTRPRRVVIPAGDISSDAYFVHSQLTDRAERIKTVLEAKPEASIKDIADIITDVSEKTIQRELNSLIEKGQVRREGERRWSRYSVIK